MLKKIFYVLLFLIVMFCAFYSNSNELYIWMYILIGIPLVSFILLVIAVFRLKFTESLGNKRVVRGENINYSLKLYNEDFFLYPYVQTNFTWITISGGNCSKPVTTFCFPGKNTMLKKEFPAVIPAAFTSASRISD